MVRLHYEPKTQLRILRDLAERHARDATDPHDWQLFDGLVREIEVLLLNPGPITAGRVLDLMERFWLVAAVKRIPQRAT